MWKNVSILTSLANFIWEIKAESKGINQNTVSGKWGKDLEMSKSELVCRVPFQVTPAFPCLYKYVGDRVVTVLVIHAHAKQLASGGNMFDYSRLTTYQLEHHTDSLIN